MTNLLKIDLETAHSFHHWSSLSKVKCLDSFNIKTVNTSTRKYKDSVFFYCITEKQSKLLPSAPKIIKSISNFFDYGYWDVIFESTIDGSILWDKLSQCHTLFQNTWKILNLKLCIIPKEVGVCKALESYCNSSKPFVIILGNGCHQRSLCQQLKTLLSGCWLYQQIPPKSFVLSTRFGNCIISVNHDVQTPS